MENVVDGDLPVFFHALKKDQSEKNYGYGRFLLHFVTKSASFFIFRHKRCYCLLNGHLLSAHLIILSLRNTEDMHYLARKL